MPNLKPGHICKLNALSVTIIEMLMPIVRVEDSYGRREWVDYRALVH